MERVMFEKDLFFAVIIALAIHVAFAFTHVYTAPHPVYFKSKNYGRLIISMVSTHIPDTVPAIKKKKPVVVREKKKRIEPVKKMATVPKKAVVTKTVVVNKNAVPEDVVTEPVGSRVKAVSPPTVPIKAPKVVLAVPRYGQNEPPVYPSIARRRGYEGVVILTAEVLVDGTVGNLKIKKSSGYNILDRSALKTVKKWKFEPGKRLGCPVIMNVEVPVRFILN